MYTMQFKNIEYKYDADSRSFDSHVITGSGIFVAETWEDLLAWSNRIGYEAIDELSSVEGCRVGIIYSKNRHSMIYYSETKPVK